MISICLYTSHESTIFENFCLMIHQKQFVMFVSGASHKISHDFCTSLTTSYVLANVSLGIWSTIVPMCMVAPSKISKEPK